MAKDKEILELIAAKETSEKGFEQLVRTYQEKVYWHVRRMLQNHEDTDDVVQEVFIKVWNNIHSFRGDSGLFTWIYRIATNEALAFMKKRKRYSSISPENSGHQAISESEAFNNSEQLHMKFMNAVNSLPKKQKLVFNMKYFDNMKYDEMAGILQTSTGGLKASYHHAVTKIKKMLAE